MPAIRLLLAAALMLPAAAGAQQMSPGVGEAIDNEGRARLYASARSRDIGGEDRLESRLWRTAPLLGVGEGATLLHDGRARTIEEAILWHGGEGQAAKDAYVALPEADTKRMAESAR